MLKVTRPPNSQSRLLLPPPVQRDEIIRLSSAPRGMWATTVKIWVDSPTLPLRNFHSLRSPGTHLCWRPRSGIEHPAPTPSLDSPVREPGPLVPLLHPWIPRTAAPMGRNRGTVPQPWGCPPQPYLHPWKLECDPQGIPQHARKGSVPARWLH